MNFGGGSMENKVFSLYTFNEINIIIVQESEYISALYISKDVEKMQDFQETKLIKRVKQQLSEYFKGRRRGFDFPVKFTGTEFQEKVWRELCNIPYGETITYSELARRCGNPKACRAAGQANNRNKLMIVVPCHRVIGKNGNLTGNAGGIAVKKLLKKKKKKYL